MRTKIVLALLVFCLSPVWAQGLNGAPVPAPPPPVAEYPKSEPPVCYPSSVGGTGGEVGIGLSDDGSWLGWWCPLPEGQWGLQTVTVLKGYVLKHPPFDPDVLKLAKAYWELNVKSLPPDPRRDALRQASREAMAGVKPVASSWVVAKNGDKTTRPAFAVTNGKRSFSSKSTVAVGSACDPSLKIVEGSITYMGVGPSLVTSCTKAPTHVAAPPTILPAVPTN